MAIIKPYVDQLKIDRSTLVTNINAKGVSVSTDDTYTTLVSKVTEIPGPDSMGVEMKKFDIFYSRINPGRLISDKDYTQEEIDKMEELLTKLEGGNNG